MKPQVPIIVLLLEHLRPLQRRIVLNINMAVWINFSTALRALLDNSFDRRALRRTRHMLRRTGLVPALNCCPTPNATSKSN
jgi:hypothetical protein